jgi:hypothetical protein
MTDPYILRKYLNILNEDLDANVSSKTSDSNLTTATPSTTKVDPEIKSPSAVSSPAVNKDVSTGSISQSKEKTMPGGYKGSGQLIGNELVTNLDAYKQLMSPQGQAAMEKITKKYKDGTLRMNIPIELQRQAGLDDTKPSKLDAPWRYEGGGTSVQLPSGSYVSGSWHKGFHDPNAPADVLPIPPMDQLNDKHMWFDSTASFLVKSGHDDNSIRRSMKHYFPNVKDASIDSIIQQYKDSHSGSKSNSSYTIDSPHDHKKYILGPVTHPGAIDKLDPEVYDRGVNTLTNLGQRRKTAERAIKSAYRTKNGADVLHAYYEVDPKMFEKGSPLFYELPGQYKVGDFTVYHQPEIDDEGQPTGRETVIAMRLGQYYKGKEKRYNDVTSYWHGNKKQWEQDKKQFLAQLKKTKSSFGID